jgi:ribose transport system ATP-binding protein
VPTLELRDVHKRYGGVIALRGAALAAEAGEVHALLGANGSGKSTLNKVLTGVVAPDRAEILLDGKPLVVAGPQDAHAERIVAVYQELSLVPDLTVAANISLAVEATRAGFLRPAAIRERAGAVLERFRAAFSDGRLPLDRRVGALSPGEQQIVEIAKALARDPRILVLDEATASLYRAQVDVLFEVIAELRAEGVLVLFTSHRMNEIQTICDRATVLRNGQTVGTVDVADATDDDLVELMIGRSGAAEAAQESMAAASSIAVGAGDTTREATRDTTRETTREEAREGMREVTRPVALRVRGLSTDRLDDIDLDLHAGEVLGLGGLAGQGQSELLSALFGAVKVRAGTVELGGETLRLSSPRRAVRAGIALVPGNRGREGLFPVRSILENLTVPSMRDRARFGALSRRGEREAARGVVSDLGVKIGALTDSVSTLSGGNQQKVVVGKWLLSQPRVVLLDDPTKGIDVGAKVELYQLIARLTADGVSVILNSSDDEELLGVSHRVLVLFEGRVVAELAGANLTHEQLVSASLHVADEEVGAA